MGEIRFVGPGKTRRYPYPVCKKMQVNSIQIQTRDNSIMLHYNNMFEESLFIIYF